MALTPEDIVNKKFETTKFREGYDQDEVDDFLDEVVAEYSRLFQENKQLKEENEKLKQKVSSGESSSSLAAKTAPAASGVQESVPAARTEAAKDSAPSTAVTANQVSPAAGLATTPSPATNAAPQSSGLTDNTQMAALANGTGPGVEQATGVLAMAQQLHDRYVNEGIEKRDKILAEAQMEASGMINEAQEKSRKSLSELAQQRSVLERKIEQLRSFERDYRARLKAYIEGQLRDLEASSSVAVPEVNVSSNPAIGS